MKEDFLPQLKTLALSMRVLTQTPSEDEGPSFLFLPLFLDPSLLLPSLLFYPFLFSLLLIFYNCHNTNLCKTEGTARSSIRTEKNEDSTMHAHTIDSQKRMRMRTRYTDKRKF